MQLLYTNTDIPDMNDLVGKTWVFLSRVSMCVVYLVVMNL